jgi:hypothetical protein
MTVRASAVVVVLAVACMAVANAAPKPSQPTPIAPTPTARERALFELGRSEERIAFGLEQPKMFGIALFRDRSLSDLTATVLLLKENHGPKSYGDITVALETLRPLIDRGDISGVDKALWGSTVIEPYDSTTPPPPPSDWWMVELGMASVDVDAARVDYLAYFLESAHPAWIAGHIAYAGRFASVVPESGRMVAARAGLQFLSQNGSTAKASAPAPATSASPSSNASDLQSFESKLSQHLAGVFVEAAFPAMVYDASAVGDARRGLAIATVNELIESPPVLGQRDSQEFIDELIDSMKSTTGDPKVLAAIADARLETSVPQQADTFEGESRLDKTSADFRVYFESIPEERSRRSILGQLAAQTFYNASNFQDSNYDATFRNNIGSIADLDAAIPGMAAARHDLATAKSGDWLAIRAKSLTVVNLIVGST